MAAPLLIPLIAAGASLGGGAMNFFSNKNQSKVLQNAQIRASQEQREAQEKYNKDYDAYQSNIRNLLGNRPELNITSQQDALQPLVNLAQNDLLASQGRAAGSELLRDDIRQSTADQVYRASQVSRTGSDLMGAIGRIQAVEYNNTRRLGIKEAQDRQRRIDTKTLNFQSAVSRSSVFNAGEQMQREQAIQADALSKYTAQLGFEDRSEANRMQSNLNFAIGNINQNAANASTNAAMMQNNTGDLLMGLGGSLMKYASQNDQIQNDANKYGVGENTADTGSASETLYLGSGDPLYRRDKGFLNRMFGGNKKKDS